MAADAFVAIKQLAHRLFPPGAADMFAKELAELIGLPDLDEKWVTPEGRDVTRLCEASDDGGFSSSRWTMQGWVLDDRSMTALRDEFPADFR